MFRPRAVCSLLTLATLGACIEPAIERCADGSLCPSDLVCDPAGGCVAEQLLTQCEDAADGAACDFLGGVEGVCADARCVAAGCGNGLVEPARGEACDDGNQLGGDGCNATCSSTGDCGNGQVDVGEECDCGTDDDALPPGCPAANGDTAAAACSLACTAHRCGNAGVDPGEACDDGNLIDGDGCASDCRSDETCGNGVRDAGEQCDDGNAVDGDGCQGWCALPSCGDGVVDGALGERCDDGNTDDVDGCASNCRSDESCGNGVPDFLAGEQCDDGDFQSQDGCSSGCQVESWTLSAATPAATPDTASVAVTAAYDAGRGVTMLYRSDAQDISETWTYDGAGWQLHVPATAPPPRYAPGLAYDAARSEVVMFGGYGGWSLRETWTWDGTTWTQRLLPAASSPPNRGSSLMTYDARREQVLCFVGGTWGDLAELWAWDGEAWSQLAVGGPPGAYPDALAYDPIRDRVVLLGGYGTPGATQRVWEWDGAAWAEATAAGGPAPDYDGAATFDTRLGAVVALRVWPTMVAWAWDGTSWTQVPSPTAPAAALATVAFDTRRGVAVSLPSFAADSASPDVWELDADGWHVASPYVPDMFFGEYQLATVPWEAEVLLVGQRTDAWSGRGFTQRLPWGPNGYSPALAADVDRRWLLAVSDGGQVERLDANTWTEVVPASYDLSIGHSPAAAYDAARGRLVMFGGNQSVGDTFVLVDDAWAVAATPDASPPARHAAAMAYDPVRERVVMFGGYRNAPPYGNLDDTWEWDGAAWLERDVASRPLPRAGASMNFDPVSRRVLLVGGGGDNALWWWDGEAWTSQQLGLSSSTATAAFDPRRRELVLASYDFADDEVRVERARLQAATADDEVCVSELIDSDRDGLAGCDDPDCLGRCAPTCLAETFEACVDVTPRCGDDVCDGAEDCALCPGDCGTCAPVCGDLLCTLGEDAVGCPGDCA